jgi:threonine/homoserine/homoserine lactone efflux protein
VGGLVHVAAATLGLSAILASSATAFNVVRYAGAAYLVYLGLRARSSGATAATGSAGAPPPSLIGGACSGTACW